MVRVIKGDIGGERPSISSNLDLIVPSQPTLLLICALFASDSKSLPGLILEEYEGDKGEYVAHDAEDAADEEDDAADLE